MIDQGLRKPDLQSTGAAALPEGSVSGPVGESGRHTVRPQFGPDYFLAVIATPRYWSYEPSARRNHGTTLSRKPM